VSALADRPTVLIVDDDRLIRELLRDVFAASGYRCHVAANGVEAIETFEAHRPALTVTDVKMPVLDGLQFLKYALSVDPDAAVLVLTGMGDVRTAVEALNGGAYDFLLKPVDPDELLITAGRALERRQLIVERRQHQDLLERRVAEATRELAATLHHLEDTYRATLEALGSAIDTRDVGTHAHSRRVRGYSLTIARGHGVPESELRDLEHGVLLHDIGKIGMRSHPEIGRRLIEKIPFLRGAVPIVYHHHERWDGTGYPLGIRGEEIPLGARIFALADALDAMTFDRPYSRAISLEAAREEILRCAGTHFDPAVVTSFMRIPLETFADIRRRSLSDRSPADAAALAVEAALSAHGPSLTPAGRG